MAYRFTPVKSVLRQFFQITILLVFVAAAFAAPGDLDETFGERGRVQTAVGTEDRGNAMVLQPDGKIVVCGRTRLGAVRFDFALARYNTDGSLDTSFGSGGTVVTSLTQPNGSEDECLATALQPDGKIIAVGAQRGSSGALVASGVIRYNPNGSLDTTFGTNGIVIVDRGVDKAVVLQPDGKIVVGGGGGSSQLANYQITRLNPNGTPDTTFGTGGDVTIDFAGSGDGVWALALQPDGKILAAGRSSALGDDDNFALARLNTDGSLDTTFGTGGKSVADFADSTDLGFGVVLQADGKIIVSGEARGGPTSNVIDFGLVRFNANGSIDTSFGNAGKVTTNFFDGVDTAFAVKIQSNGKIVAAGISGGSSTAFGVARYNANGTIDSTFGNGGIVETFYEGIDEGRALQIQPDGKIVVAGTARGGGILGQIALARYLGDAPVAPRAKAFDFDGDGKADISVFRPTDTVWYLNRSTQGFYAAQFGLSSDRIAPADFDGDGKTDIAVFRDGVWYWLGSSNGSVGVRQFGIANDVPVPADYTGDGRADLAVYRGGTWYTLNLANNQTSVAGFGISTDKAVPADFDGDGKTDFAVFREGVWHHLRSSDNGYRVVQFGIASDVPTVGDYDGDTRADQAVYRAGVWYVLRSSDSSSYAQQFGLANDIPVAADYDGDGKTDISVYRDGVWHTMGSQQGYGAFQFGISNDRPVPTAFVP